MGVFPAFLYSYIPIISIFLIFLSLPQHPTDHSPRSRGLPGEEYEGNAACSPEKGEKTCLPSFLRK